MRKLTYLFLVALLSAQVPTSCRIAKEEPLGDTIPARLYEPREDIALPADTDSLTTDTMCMDTIKAANDKQR